MDFWIAIGVFAVFELSCLALFIHWVRTAPDEYDLWKHGEENLVESLKRQGLSRDDLRAYAKYAEMEVGRDEGATVARQGGEPSGRR